MTKYKKTVIATADDLILMTESNVLFVNPNLDQILEVLRGLEPVDGNSFCWLEDQKRGYVQTLRGENGLLVEWMGLNTPEQHYFRAGYEPFSNVSKPLLKGKGENPGYQSELLELSDVEFLFTAFLRDRKRPDDFHWREVFFDAN